MVATKKSAKSTAKASRQGISPKKGVSSRSGTAPPKHTQFGQPNGNPRSNGHWRPEDTISYQYRRIFKMTQSEFEKFKAEPKLTMAQIKAIRMFEKTSSDGVEIKAIAEITDRTEGKARQEIEMSVEETARNPFEGLSEAELRKLISK